MSASVLIYEWEAWDGYMLPGLLPEPSRMKADPFQSARQILDALPPKLSAFAFHLNCTRTASFPLCRTELLGAFQSLGIPVLNGMVTDIGKRRLQAYCEVLGLPTVAAAQHGPPDELLIVKTDLNHAGFGEKRLSIDQARALNVIMRAGPIRNIDDYRILTRAEVPQSWWEDPLLAVERFVENSRRRKYRAYFAGSHHVVSIWIDENPIKRLRSTLNREELLTCDDVLECAGHPSLPSSFQIGCVTLLQHLRMDFGAIDFVEDEAGVCYVIDVNSTSYGRGLDKAARQHLRSGLMKRLASPHILQDTYFALLLFSD